MNAMPDFLCFPGNTCLMVVLANMKMMTVEATEFASRSLIIILLTTSCWSRIQPIWLELYTKVLLYSDR